MDPIFKKKNIYSWQHIRETKVYRYYLLALYLVNISVERSGPVYYKNILVYILTT